MIRSIRSPARRRIPTLPAVAALAALLASLALPVASAADYLSAINEEGSRLETLGKAREERERLQRLDRVAQPPAAKPVPGDQAAFERELNTEFPASYALYSMMSPDDRAKVYAEYQQAHRGGAARFFPVLSRIIALSTKQR